jgi:hypothetical protein
VVSPCGGGGGFHVKSGGEASGGVLGGADGEGGEELLLGGGEGGVGGGGVLGGNGEGGGGGGKTSVAPFCDVAFHTLYKPSYCGSWAMGDARQCELTGPQVWSRHGEASLAAPPSRTSTHKQRHVGAVGPHDDGARVVAELARAPRV